MTFQSAMRFSVCLPMSKRRRPEEMVAALEVLRQEVSAMHAAGCCKPRGESRTKPAGDWPISLQVRRRENYRWTRLGILPMLTSPSFQRLSAGLAAEVIHEAGDSVH